MLGQHDRETLLERLRPPDGYSLERAFATTFSLDLLALLTAPLAFSRFDGARASGEANEDGALGTPRALLRALREHARRITVFAHAGRTRAPQRPQPLLGFLERCVVGVLPKTQGFFHAKLWVLRFSAPERPRKYRLVIPSRNLTFDQAWDTVLVLDGDVRDRSRAIAANRPLADFLRMLPTLAVDATDAALPVEIEETARDLERVAWEFPHMVEEIGFWPLGVPGYDRSPFDGRIDRLLVVSPFLSPEFLEEALGLADHAILVSSLDELRKQDGRLLRGFARVCSLTEAADPDVYATRVDDEESGGSSVIDLDEVPPDGLHAKLFIADAGWKATLWTGSANATTAAFGHPAKRGTRRTPPSNVELMVALHGPKSAFGIDALLDPQPSDSWGRLLEEFHIEDATAVVPEDEDGLASAVDQVRKHIAAASQSLRLVIEPGSGDEDAPRYRVRLVGPALGPWPSSVVVCCWLLTIPSSNAVRLARVPSEDGETLADLGECAVGLLTTFVGIEVTARAGEESVRLAFVLNLRAFGMPDDRDARLVASVLGDREHTLRYLRLLLAGDAWEVAGAIAEDRADGRDRTGAAANDFGAPLFESLVKAYARSPELIDEVAAMVAELERTPAGRELLPVDFHRIWDPIWTARQEDHARARR